MQTRSTPAFRIENRNHDGAAAASGFSPANGVSGGNMAAAQSKFELSEITPGTLLLRCTGGLSWEDRNLLAECVERRLTNEEHCAGVIVDMASVEFINSAGLGALFQLAQRLRSQNRRLVLTRAQPAFSRLFQLSGLTRLARVADSIDQATQVLAQAGNDVEITMEAESNGVVRR